MYKKIDVFIKTPNGWQYLWSTNSCKKCKEAVSRAKEHLKMPSMKVPHEKAYGIKIDENTKIMARFSK
jgi:hypothetical protein